MKDRLKASELLGKSDAMFTDNLRIDAKVELMKLSDEELNARLERAYRKPLKRSGLT